METCSNCGATNRPGAKFCTSCGVRLPTPSRPTSADWDRPAAESTTAAAATTMPEPAKTAPLDGEQAATETSGEADATDASWSASTGRDEAAAAQATEPEPEPGAASEPASWSWGQAETPVSGSPNDTDATDATAAPEEARSEAATTEEGEAPVAAGDDTEASTGGPEGDASSTLSSWAAQWTGEYAAAPEVGEEQQSTTDDLPAAEAEPEAGQPATEEAAAVARDESALGPATATPARATAQSGLASVSGTGVEPPAVESGQRVSDAPSAADDQADALRRAGDVIEELRGLLPLLAAPPAPAAVEPQTSAADSTAAPVPDTGRVADELAAARAGGVDTTDLRRALEAARDHPRDVDTMIDIVGRIGPMLAALDAHDRYAAAIDRAIGQLRGENDAATSPEPEQDERGFQWQSR